MRCAEQIQTFPQCKVKTISKVDDRPNDTRLPYLASALLPFRPFPGALLIRFPKINSPPEPIISAPAWEKPGIATHDAIADFAFASVVPNENRTQSSCHG